MKNRQAEVYVNAMRAGTLRQEPGRYLFEYDADYLAASHLPAVSLTMPKTQRLYLAAKLFPFFVGLLAEGTNRSMQARALHLNESDDFSLLLATAHQQTIGAVTVRELL